MKSVVVSALVFSLLNFACSNALASPTPAPTASPQLTVRGDIVRAIVTAYSHIERMEAFRGRYEPLELYKVSESESDGEYVVTFTHQITATRTTISGIHGGGFEYHIRKGDFEILSFKGLP